MSEILVITCPSGKQSTRLIPLLYEKGQFTLRLAAHSDDSIYALHSRYPKAEVVRTDLASLPECQRLLHGATAIYAVHPSFHSREKEIGFNLIDAAVTEKQRPGNVFKHFICSTVLNTQHRNLQQHDLKSLIEERLFLSPMDCYTIVKPTNFMDAYPVKILKTQDKPYMERLWDPNVPNSLIALSDLAEASAKILMEREAHFLAEYPLSSTLPLSDRDVAMVISKKIGKDVQVGTPSFETGVKRALGYLYGSKADALYTNDQGESDLRLAAQGDLRGDLSTDAAERLVLFYNRRGLKGSPNVLRWLLKKEPMSVEQWVDAQLA